MSISGIGAGIALAKIKPIAALAARRFRQSGWWKSAGLGRF
jgi:hypothetical protein